MKKFKILAVAAVAVAMIGVSSTAFANKKGNSGGSGNGRGNVVVNQNNGGHGHNFGSQKQHHPSFQQHFAKSHYPKYVKYCHPVVIGVPVTVAPVGGVVELPGYFGPHPGKVVLDVCGVVYHPRIVSWTPHCVVVEIPWMKIYEPVHAKMIVIGCDGTPYRPMLMKIVPW